MNAMMMNNMSAMFAEDVNVPELRNARLTAARAMTLGERLSKLFRGKR